MKINFFLLLVSCFMLISCGRQKHVYFTELINSNKSDRQDVVRIYIDKNGHFYPNEKIHIPYKDFFDPESKGKTNYNHLNSGSLEYYFTGRYLSKNGQYLFNNDHIFKKRTTALSNYYIIDSSQNLLKTFEESQEKITLKLSDSISSILNNIPTKTLVILIHGFNDPNPTGDYQKVRDFIRTRKDERYGYLEVYWDGLTANQGDPSQERIWKRAQGNSQQTAVALRNLLNKLSKSYNLRIITHSLGASVGTATLFNTMSKWNDKKALNRYFDAAANIPAPQQSDIRIGMIAPAIPGVNTFIDFNDRNWEVNEDSNNIKKIVVGYNSNDGAVSKRFMKSDFLSARAGATTLGSNYNREFYKTKEILFSLNYSKEYLDNIFIGINFQENPESKVPEEHGLFYYVQRDKAFGEFIDQMFLK